MGLETRLELGIRSCFRLVYFDSIRLHAHRGCLLNIILHKQPIWFQARLIYLLFGPMSSDAIDWEKFTRDRSRLFAQPHVDEEQAYFDLSRAFAVLNRSVHAQKSWNSNSKLALLNELIGNGDFRSLPPTAPRSRLAQPAPWRSEFVAELLFYCGRELLTNVMIAFAVSEQHDVFHDRRASLQIKNYHKEYAQLVHSLCIVSESEHRTSGVEGLHLGRASTQVLLRNRSDGHRGLIGTLYTRCSTKLDYSSFTERLSVRDEKLDRGAW